MELSGTAVGVVLKSSLVCPVLCRLPADAAAKKLNGNPHYILNAGAVITKILSTRRLTLRHSSLQLIVLTDDERHR